jgi:hypothetical protein
LARARPWFVVLAAALACAGLGALARLPWLAVAALAPCGAAVAAAVRAYAGSSPAALLAAGASALLAACALVSTCDVHLVHAACAVAAGAFAIAELVRPMPPDASPLPAYGAALVAAALDPSFAALAVIASVRIVSGPWLRPRGAVVAPIVGGLVVAVAFAAALVHRGPFEALWARWAGPRHGMSLAAIGDVLQPVAGLAALAGLALAATAGRLATASLVAAFAGALLVDVRTGTLGGATVALAAIAGGIAVARLAAVARWTMAQAFVGGTAAALVLFAPMWGVVAALR